ncbi:MAG: nucleotidyltransferase domain-containing protein [Ginsengibacter sp.]
MLTRKDILKAVSIFIDSANNSGLFIDRIFLFGSYAKGNPHQYSDIDLALFSNQFSYIHYENNALIQSTLRLPQMQLHMYPSEEFEDDDFVQEIKKHAIDLTYLLSNHVAQ